MSAAERRQRQTIYSGKKVTLIVEEITTAHGKVLRETVQVPGAVVIVPVLADGKVCLLRQHRPAVNKTLVELPAGTLEPGEIPIVAAKRELAEETGYDAEHVYPVIEFYPSPGILTEKMYLFVAEGLRPGPRQLDADEEIETWPIPFEQALDLIRTGTIEDGKTIVGLLLYAWQKGMISSA
ncbi:MAG: NUDIX hydrolase [Gemmataceae bacterium]